MRPVVVGAAVLVSYLAVGLQPAVAAANLLQNGDFSQGLTGWQEVCETFGEQPDGSGCTSTSASGLTVTGSHIYTGAQQTVATSTGVVLSGTVTVTSMVLCNTDDGVLVRAILRDASNTQIGRLTFYHHPYTSGCTPYTYANTSTDYYREMPSWVPGTGAQSFQMDIGALMSNLPGTDPSAVRSITVELLDYADYAQPTITFSSFDLSSGSAPPASGQPAPVNTAPPTIVGTRQVGDTLTVSSGSWSGTVTRYAHQWFDCNGAGTSCSAIAGATGTTYTLSASDAGHWIAVQEIAFSGSTPAASPARSALVGPVVSATGPPPPPPPPVLGKSVDVAAVSGSVFVTLPNGETVPVSAALNLPSGTQVDARSGSLRLTTAAARHGQTQTGVFGGAVFKIAQTRAGANRGLTTLSLVEGVRGAPSYRACRAGRSAHTARLSSRVLQTLHSSVHGRFRTRGRYSAGTVRGTAWDTTDRCDGTLTVVHRGTVLVTDFVRHRIVAVHAGHRYFAKAP